MKKGFIFVLTLFVAILIFFSLLPTPLFDYNKFPGEDKILHFLVYMVGGIILELSFKRRGVLHWLFFSFFLIFPALNEYYQTFIPGRDGSLKDFLSGASGFLIGVLVGWLISLCGKIRSDKSMDNPELKN